VVIAAGTVVVLSGLTGERASSYTATAIILDPPERQAGPNIQTVARLATIEKVADRVANRLGYAGAPRALTDRVEAAAYEDTDLMRITAMAARPREARALAGAFAQELLGYLRDERAVAIAAEAEQITLGLRGLRRQIERADQGIVAGRNVSTLRAQRQALLGQYEELAQRYEELAKEDPATDLHIVQRPIPRPVPPAGEGVLQTLPGRLAATTVLAMLVGGGLAILFERLSRRLPRRRPAEGLSSVPTLGDVPLARDDETPDGAAGSERKPRNDFRYLGRPAEPRKPRRRIIRHRRRSEGQVP
jgi:hypothetical protein